MPKSISKQRVLIADDEKNIADTLALILGFLGYRNNSGVQR